MKRFVFSLWPVAVIRANRELRAREALAISIDASLRADIRLESALGQVAESGRQISAARRETFQAATEAASGQAYRRECAAAAEAGQFARAARDEVSKRREICVEANREVRVVARLEEKARAVHRLLRLRAEQSEIDEIAGFRAFKRNPFP